MSTTKFTAIAAAVTLGAGMAAHAGGYTPPVVEPVAEPFVEAPVADWAGGYVGATLGYAFSGDDRVGVSDANNNLIGHLGEQDEDGFNGGIRAGYRWQRGNWVYGPEIGFDLTDIRGDTEDTLAGIGLVTSNVKVKNVLALRFKTGYTVRPDTLVYGIVGWARADVDYDVNGNDLGYDTDGYIVGLGIERKINDRMSITGEYEYTEYDKETIELGGYHTRATTSYNNVKVGLNFSF